MKVMEDKVEISEGETIRWAEVEALRLVNDKLALIMKDGQVVELPGLRPAIIDMAFRAFDSYRRRHPTK